MRGSLQTSDGLLLQSEVSVHEEEKAIRRKERYFYAKIQNRIEAKKYGRVQKKEQQSQRIQKKRYDAQGASIDSGKQSRQIIKSQHTASAERFQQMY